MTIQRFAAAFDERRPLSEKTDFQRPLSSYRPDGQKL